MLAYSSLGTGRDPSEASVCHSVTFFDTPAFCRANMAVSATLTSETIQRKEAEQKTSDLTERLAAAAEAKIDDAIRISDLKTLLWEEQARTKAVQALSRPTIATDANKQQEASDR